MFPFHYSSLNYELAQSTPSGSLNILWNQLNQKSIANSMMYMTPTFDFNIGYEYPEFGMYGNNLLNPILAVQQTLQAFQNGSWMNGMNSWFNNNWQMPWNMPWQNTPGSSAGENAEYDALKALITKYKEIGTKSSLIKPELLDKINEALNKSGKPEEKLAALKEVYKQLNKNLLAKALLDLPEYKDALEAAGYKFNGTNKDNDKQLNSDLNSVDNEIKSGKADKLVLAVPSESESQILRVISYWNDKHTTNENRGIIRLVANNLPASDSEQETHKTAINNLAMSLINKADNLKAEVEGEFSKLDAAKEEVSEALTNANKEFTKDNLMELADKFDTLYAMLRMMEAEKIKNSIKTKYSFLNDISSTDRNIVDDNLVIENTKADLKNEGINIDEIEVDEIHEEGDEGTVDIDEIAETAEEKVNALVEENKLKETDKEGVYASKTESKYEPAKLYMIKDGKLVELKGAKNIDKDGKCTMTDGTVKELKDVETAEVTAQNIIDYNNTLERVNNLVSKDTLVKVRTTLNGQTLYSSKGKNKDDQYQYFIVRNNELKRIVCDYVIGEYIIRDDRTMQFEELTDSDFAAVKDSEILTEDAAAVEARRQNEEQEKLEKMFNKKLKAPHKDEDGYELGRKIVDDLEWVTTGTEWRNAVSNIYSITEDNVYSVILGYKEDKNIGADNIIRQILTENGREDGVKMDLIIHIVDKVLAYGEKYGSYSPASFKELYELRKTLKTETIINTATAEKIDDCILNMFAF